MKNQLIISIVLGFFVVLFVGIVLLGTTSNAQCLREKDAINLTLNGRIINVYLDPKNHGYPTLEISANGEITKTNFLLFDKSGCFNYLQPSDSILKKNGSLLLKVFREKDSTVFELNYGCDNK
jgi:hypothetical protein